MTSSAERSPQPLNPFVSLAGKVVELRERVENGLTSAAEEGPQHALRLVRAAFDVLAQLHESALHQADLQRAEGLAMRELTAAKRHLEFALRSPETRAAACELAARALIRALDALLNALVPHTIPPR